MMGIDNFMNDNFPNISYRNPEIIYGGKAGSRTATPHTLIELDGKLQRDNLVKDTQQKKLTFEVSGKSITIKRAKTQRQIDRNTFIFRAFDKLKEVGNNKQRNVKIVWLIEVDGKIASYDRLIEVDGKTVFTQKPSDLIGTFSPEYQQICL